MADAGDAAARSIVASAGEALGAAVAQLVNMLDPEAIVIGGGLGMVGGVYRASIDAALREYVWSEMHRGIPLLSAQLGADAGFIGAAVGRSRQ
jgi:glucokinase